MCLIVFANQMHPTFPLVLMANRDEFYERPTQPMHWWEANGILAGKDLRGGGTWFGISRTGRWAAVTNFRSGKEKTSGVRSRGELVVNFLESGLSPDDFFHGLIQKPTTYNGFNLLVSDGQEVYWHSNRDPGLAGSTSFSALPPGLHGLSNALLNTPWPKVELAKRKLRTVVESADDPQATAEKAFAVFTDCSRPDETKLPDTGIGIEKERKLSSIFIAEPEWKYGTRCSTALIKSADGKILVKEKSFLTVIDDEKAGSDLESEIFEATFDAEKPR